MTMTETDPETELQKIAAETPTIAPNIYEAIRRVSAEVGRIAKSGRGPESQGSYPFMPTDDIVANLAPLFSEHGIVVVAKVLDELVEVDEALRFNQDGTPARDGRQNNIRTRVRVRFQFRFVSVADGSRVKVIVLGEAHDTADKALNKAETAAYKKALIRTFSIVAGEKDPDSIDPNAEDENRAAATAPGARRSRRERSIDQSRGTAGKSAPTAPAAAPRGPAAPVEQHDALEPVASEADVAIAAQEAARAAIERERAQTITEAAAERREQTWRPAQEDIDAAEEMSTATEQHLAGNPAKVDEAFIPAPQPERQATQTEQRAEDIAAIKSELRRAWSARGLTREQANTIGDRVTGKPRTEWMLRKDTLGQVLKAIQDGETA